jgi:endonuclease I
MAIAGVNVFTTRVQQETAGRSRQTAGDGGESCPIQPSLDALIADFIPKEVHIHPSDHARMKSALAELAKAPGRVYYDAARDAADSAAYYKGVDPKQSPSALYDSLSDLVTRTHTTKLDYSPSTELYPWVDLHEDGKLHSIYSGKDIDPAEAISGDTRMAALRTATTMAIQMAHGLDAPARMAAVHQVLKYNCEHVVPQSWFDKKLPMRGDLHHLFACDPGCNSMRGSVPYSDQPGDAGMTCGKISAGKDSFEPAAGKGAVARATLYFLLRYPGYIGDEHGEYSTEDVKTLVRWSDENPVTDYERHRNAAIAERQGNRNPLIDHPDWADKIDFTRGLGHPH